MKNLLTISGTDVTQQYGPGKLGNTSQRYQRSSASFLLESLLKSSTRSMLARSCGNAKESHTFSVKTMLKDLYASNLVLFSHFLPSYLEGIL